MFDFRIGSCPSYFPYYPLQSFTKYTLNMRPESPAILLKFGLQMGISVDSSSPAGKFPVTGEAAEKSFKSSCHEAQLRKWRL